MSSNTPDINAIREALERNLAKTEAAEQGFNVQQMKDSIRKTLEHNLDVAPQVQSEVEDVIALQMEMAQLAYRDRKAAWDAHVRKRRAKKLLKAAVGATISHFTVIGGAVLEAPALYKTDRHIKKLANLSVVPCKCEGMACKAELRPFILMQKLKKFDSSTNKLVPVVSTAQTVANLLDGKNPHTEYKAQQLMNSCKNGCLFANYMAAELLGGDKAAWTRLEALKQDSLGWKYLEEKMGAS